MALRACKVPPHEASVAAAWRHDDFDDAVCPPTFETVHILLAASRIYSVRVDLKAAVHEALLTDGRASSVHGILGAPVGETPAPSSALILTIASFAAVGPWMPVVSKRST